METSNPGQILQRNGIEVNPEDRRTTSQILAHYIDIGHIVIPHEINLEEQNKV